MNLMNDEWQKAIVTLIFKGGNKDRSKAEKYRPISLTSITCKVLEHVNHRNIISHLDQQIMFQNGFRKSRSCETQLIKTVNDLAKSPNEIQQVDSILLGFSKAFDVVLPPKTFTTLQFSKQKLK